MISGKHNAPLKAYPKNPIEPKPMPTLHPLEPLSALEIAEAVRLLKTNPVFNAKTRIISIMLREPPKSVVYSWPKTDKVSREADAVLFDNGRNVAIAATLNLDAGKVVQVKEAPPGSQPTMSIDEQVNANRLFSQVPNSRRH